MKTSLLLVLLAGVLLANADDTLIDPCNEARSLNTQANQATPEQRPILRCQSRKMNIKCFEMAVERASGAALRTQTQSLENAKRQFQTDNCDQILADAGLSGVNIVASLMLLSTSFFLLRTV